MVITLRLGAGMLADHLAMGLEPEAGTGASVRANASAHGLSFAPAISLSKRPATSIASPTPTSASGYGPPATATRLGKRAASPALTSLSSPTEPSSAKPAMRFTARSGEERADGSLRVVYAGSHRDCRPCPLREQCQWEGHETRKPRQVSVRLASAAGGSCTAALALLPPPSPSASLYAVGA